MGVKRLDVLAEMPLSVRLPEPLPDVLLTGPEREPVEMNAPGAERNFQLVLNVVHWLTRSL